MEESTLLINLNKQAAEKISENDLKKALTLLLRAESHLTDSTANSLKTYTLINLSSVYARLNNPVKSLSILCSIASKIEDKYLYACTLLNIASLKSQLFKHEESLAHNIQAIELLKSLESNINTSTSLVVAYRNIAMLSEYLGHHQEGLKFDRKAQQLAMESLGPGNLLTIALSKYKLISSVRQSSESKASTDSSLSSMRFLTGDRIQPMHRTKSMWRKRLNSLPKGGKTQQNKSFMLAKGKIREPERIFRFGTENKTKLEALMEESEGDGSKISVYKRNIKEIKIISLKQLDEIKRRYKAAIVIQKATRGYLARKAQKIIPNKSKIDSESKKETGRRLCEENSILAEDNEAAPVPRISTEKSIEALEDQEVTTLKTEVVLSESHEFSNEITASHVPVDSNESPDYSYKETFDVLEEIINLPQVFKRPETLSEADCLIDSLHITPVEFAENHSQHYANEALSQHSDMISSEVRERKMTGCFETIEEEPESSMNFSPEPQELQKPKAAQAAQRIQRTFRAKLRRLLGDLQLPKALQAIVKIQSFFRALRRRKLAEANAAAILIQKNYRMHSVRMIYKSIKDAISFIQLNYRKHLISKRQKLIKST